MWLEHAKVEEKEKKRTNKKEALFLLRAHGKCFLFASVCAQKLYAITTSRENPFIFLYTDLL